MIELWKEIKGTNGEYRVSSFGRVKSLKNGKETILNGWIQNTGYKTVSINNEKESIHRLVAEAFIPNPFRKPQVNHIDSNRQNNRVENLEWVTHQENVQHAFRTGRMDNAIKLMVSKKIRAKNIGQFDFNNNLISVFKGSGEAQKYLNNLGVRVNGRNIRKVCKGERYKAGGYHWKYLD